MLFKRRDPVPEDRTCIACGRREGAVRIEGGYACRLCYPPSGVYDRPTVDEIVARRMRDPEMLRRADLFEETESFGDLRFDDRSREFLKGPWPSYCLPVLSYGEVLGYRILIDGRPVAFNSVDGGRAVFRPMTDEALRSAARTLDSMVLEIDSGRSNVRFVPYELFGRMRRIADTREECLRAAVALSMKLDSIVEANIASGVGKQPDKDKSD